MKRYYFVAIILISTSWVINSCKVSTPPQNTNIEQVQNTPKDNALDSIIRSLVSQKPEKVYRPERTKYFSLLHTKLKLRFDWEHQHVLGEAVLVLKPYFYPQSVLDLDAKGYDLHKVGLFTEKGVEELEYSYNDTILHINLDKEYSRNEQVNIFISYTAKPNELEVKNGKAITEDKGLYFINPLGEDEGKPRQIWTQGETESNSKWFPTIDAPNQRCTQEMYITVNDTLVTLSNGSLISSQYNNDGTRTDYWKMDKPHAPYLFMLAVGDFAVVKDKWKNIPLAYYVDPEYEQYAKDIFGNTPEMIDYFSEILDYPFPWSKYSQIIVHDFVSGAMENTTATVFMESVQSDKRELIDQNWDDIISHELIHHWFGDLVTCESWANLTLNEAFGTYGEYLWLSHKFGTDEGAFHLYEDYENYMSEAREEKKDLIRFYYDEADDMFDSHSYQKVGLILHMLRDYLGDEAFFKSLSTYLKKFEYKDVEVHDFRLAFEEVTGEDMNWFFDQWFLSAGHPQFEVEKEYIPDSDKLIIRVKQVQDQEEYPIFKMPVDIDVWVKNKKTTYTKHIGSTNDVFEFQMTSEPDLVLFNSDFNLLCEKEEEKSKEEYFFQYVNYDAFRPKYEAFEYFSETPEDSLSRIVYEKALEEDFWLFKYEALDLIGYDTVDLTEDLESKILAMTNDKNSLVRAGALMLLFDKKSEKYHDLMIKAMNDSSYSVMGVGLHAYLKIDNPDIDETIAKFKDYNNFNIIASLADYFITTENYDEYNWFNAKFDVLTNSELWYMTKMFGIYLSDAPDTIIEKGIVRLEDIARHNHMYQIRLAAYQSIEIFAEREGVKEILQDIVKNEEDPRLLKYAEN